MDPLSGEGLRDSLSLPAMVDSSLPFQNLLPPLLLFSSSMFNPQYAMPLVVLSPPFKKRLYSIGETFEYVQ